MRTEIKFRESAGSRLFATADTHFGHANILKHCPHRCLDQDMTVERMNDVLVALWNNFVRPSDTVFHLGDFAFLNRRGIAEILERLNGQIFLVPGNHDRLEYFESLQSGKLELLAPQVDLRFECDDGENVRKQDFVLNHFPMVVWERSHHGVIQLHGHCHGSLDGKLPGKRLDVGVDSVSVLGRPALRPVSFRDILTAAQALDIWKPDHHDTRE